MICIMKRIVLLAGAAFLISTPAMAEYYRYVDENGMQRYTDDLSSVPVDQRPNVQSYETIKSNPVPSGGDLATPQAGEKPEGATWRERTANQADALDQERIGLEKTQQTLQTERDALLKEKPSVEDGENARKAYRDKVKQLNAKVADYEKQHAAYKEKVEAFNQEYKK